MNAEILTLDQTIDAVMQLPSEQREMLIAILHRRQIDERRQEIAEDAQESLALFRAGKLKPQSTENIIQALHQSLQEPE
jgi:hypothetical protein